MRRTSFGLHVQRWWVLDESRVLYMLGLLAIPIVGPDFFPKRVSCWNTLSNSQGSKDGGWLLAYSA